MYLKQDVHMGGPGTTESRRNPVVFCTKMDLEVVFLSFTKMVSAGELLLVDLDMGNLLKGIQLPSVVYFELF